MATLAFKPYTYKPTAPRFKSTATHRRPAPEKVSSLNKLQHITSSGASLSTPRPAADDDRGYRPGIRGTGTVFGGSDIASNNETDDDRDFPTIEELLFTNLRAQGFTAGVQGPDKTSGVEEVAIDEKGGSVDQSRSAQSDNSGGSPDDPIDLLGDGNLSASEAEVDDVSLRTESATTLGAGLFDGAEAAIDSITPAPCHSSDGWHDIDDFPEPAPSLRLAEQGTPTPDPLPTHAPSSRLSSEPLHDGISTDSKATSPSSSPPPRHCRASPETQLSQEGRLHTGRGVADEHELVNHALDTLFINEEARKQQEAEQEKDKGNSEGKEGGPQQEMNIAAPVVTADRASGSLRPANRRQSLRNLDLSPEPSHNEIGSRCDRDSDDKLNSSDSAGDDEKEPRPAKRKQPFSSHDSSARKKRRHRLQRSPPRHHRPLSEPYRQYPKAHSPLNQRSRIATSLSAKGQLPSPAPSMPQSINTTMSLGDSSLGQLSRATLPMLTEITFRPHSAHCYAFTAIVRDGCDGRGVSLAQVIRLIASTGHVGKIDDFTIKPIEQHSYLLSGFSWHASSRLSSSGTALSTTAEAGRDHVETTRIRPQEGRGCDTGALASQRSKPSSSNDESGLSDSEQPDFSSDDDAYTSEAEERGGLSVRMNIPWDPVDEQRLVAYKKEDKPWDWIFKKFPRRTRAAVRTRWTIAQRKAEPDEEEDAAT